MAGAPTDETGREASATMARPDRGRRARRRVPLLLATLAVVAAAAGVYFAQPSTVAGQDTIPVADNGTSPVVPPQQPKPLPAGAVPAEKPPAPMKKAEDDTW